MMMLLFPAKYEVRGPKGGWTQKGTITVRAENGRLAVLLAREEIMRRCGLRPQKLEMGEPR